MKDSFQCLPHSLLLKFRVEGQIDRWGLELEWNGVKVQVEEQVVVLEVSCGSIVVVVRVVVLGVAVVGPKYSGSSVDSNEVGESTGK